MSKSIQPVFQPLQICSPALAAELARELLAMDPWRRLGYRQKALEAFFLRPACDAERYLIRLDGEVAGTLCLKRPWLRGVYLEQLAILPPWQRLGLGRRALAFIEETHPEAANIWLAVSAFNEAARHFYAANGFVELCIQDDLLAPGEDEVLMRKRLA